MLVRTATSLHSGGGERESSAQSVRVGEGAAADVASGLSPALSDGDALWIGVCLSAGGRRERGRKGEAEREREREVRHRESSKWEETTRATGATNYTWQQEFFWIEASGGSSSNV